MCMSMYLRRQLQKLLRHNGNQYSIFKSEPLSLCHTLIYMYMYIVHVVHVDLLFLLLFKGCYCCYYTITT